MKLSLPQKILGQTYEKLKMRSDLGTSEENLTLNLRKTFDQCSIRSFGFAVLDPQITRYPRRFSPQLCSANYPLQYPHIRRSAHLHFTPGRQPDGAGRRSGRLVTAGGLAWSVITQLLRDECRQSTTSYPLMVVI